MDREAVQLLQELIRIDSQNPPGDERKIVSFIRAYLENLGIRARVFEFNRRRLNLVCRIKSRNAKKNDAFYPSFGYCSCCRHVAFPSFFGKNL